MKNSPHLQHCIYPKSKNRSVLKYTFLENAVIKLSILQNLRQKTQDHFAYLIKMSNIQYWVAYLPEKFQFCCL